jgi:hypothetical protein
MSDTMIHYLISIAQERPITPPPILTQPVPASFTTSLFFAMATAPSLTLSGLTRHGIDAAMDALFALPGVEPLLQHPVEYQNEIAAAIGLADLSDTFRAHWTHIIVPAWNQHAEIRKIMVATAEAK